MQITNYAYEAQTFRRRWLSGVKTSEQVYTARSWKLLGCINAKPQQRGCGVRQRVGKVAGICTDIRPW